MFIARGSGMPSSRFPVAVVLVPLPDVAGEAALALILNWCM